MLELDLKNRQYLLDIFRIISEKIMNIFFTIPFRFRNLSVLRVISRATEADLPNLRPLWKVSASSDENIFLVKDSPKLIISSRIEIHCAFVKIYCAFVKGFLLLKFYFKHELI